MIESPLLQEILAEERLQTQREDIIAFLTSRFGSEARELEADLKAIEDTERLNELIKLAATCRGLKSFRKQLSR